ncbi:MULTISPECIES: hypothetical protein [unclassified Enterococcus]|uniref:hypothetical protein n=1 Tax=unclassified Enterococcus TaxID=2608891 RepID=UPI001555EDD5|nr:MULTISPECIES: hypothetical protein [unclassified Enterococcus]MBS7577677.1 hypothetical protein [Enterococcus sp. MMGLQ5-2]MBS7584129.1 hypothetical protein [Enterococcus sp. MMGLQ5-1]NPD11987.1 hypothetical protein [Enterococcus sp. MMGLQ5-1]NPD37510.1 hypothetical protein [Enterococcus sp. MMGLQ5-2]
MKKLTFFLCLITLTGVLSSCDKQQVEQFNQDTLDENGIVLKAKAYTDEQYKLGEVPLHEFVQIKGEITKTDQKNNLISKNTRFILKTEQGKYQILHGVDEKFKIGDTVTVYGEYYGFIKAMKIEQR